MSFVPFYFQTCWISESHSGTVIKVVQSYEKYISVKAQETCSTITTPLHNYTMKGSQKRGSGVRNSCSVKAPNLAA